MSSEKRNNLSVSSFMKHEMLSFVSVFLKLSAKHKWITISEIIFWSLKHYASYNVTIMAEIYTASWQTERAKITGKPTLLCCHAVLPFG